MSNDDSIPDDWNDPATSDDLRWWLTLAPTLRWKFAKSMPDIPHWYVLPGKTPGFSQADALRVGRVIRTYGEKGKFWRRTNLYLFTEDRARKFWCMWSADVPRPRNCSVVNLAFADQVYGPQEGFDEEWVERMRSGSDDD